MCPRSFSRRPVKDLDWPLFEKICDEVGKHGPILKVFLQKDGEPLLHPRITEMVAKLRQVNAAKTIGIITNGTLLTENLFRKLAQAGLHDLIVSIDAVNSQDYLSLKGVDRFEQVVQNTRTAIEIKRKNGWKFPQIKARLVARKGREWEVEQFKNEWEKHADMVDITPYHTWMGAVDDQRTYYSSQRYACSLLWYTGVINSDGKVSPCCIDFDQKGVLGEVETHGFSAIWNGKEFDRLRKLHLLENYSETKICGPCEYWMIKENIHRWLKRKYRI